jgi:RNA polymerase sigma factor (sigma-70 family)
VNFSGDFSYVGVVAPLRQPPDASILEASTEQPDAFVALFERHFKAVYRFVARRLGSDAASDLAAETFVRAFERRAVYRPERDSALPWLLGIAVRLVSNERRRELRQLETYALLAREEASRVTSGGPQRASGGDATEALVAALQEMSTGDRDVLLLYAWGDLDYEAIAEALEIPLGTVRSRLNRARNKLQSALATSSNGTPIVAAPKGGHLNAT